MELCINGIDTDGPKFLEACEQCDDALVKSLVQNGISTSSLNAVDKSGKTGFSHVCSNGDLPILDLLLQLPEVDVNIPDKEGNTPLILAAQAGHSDVMNVLLRQFPEIGIDKSNNQGFTALMKAAIQGRSKCAKLLLCAGASPYKRDLGRGFCALEWARYCGRDGCAETVAAFMEKTLTLGMEGHLDIFQPIKPCRSASNLSGKGSHNQYSPVRLINKVRRSLPSTSSTESLCPLRSLEDVTRLLYLPVFPEKVVDTFDTPLFWKLRCQASTRQFIIPKVEVSKDDNWFYEMPFFAIRKKERQNHVKKITKQKSI